MCLNGEENVVQSYWDYVFKILVSEGESEEVHETTDVNSSITDAKVIISNGSESPFELRFCDTNEY